MNQFIQATHISIIASRMTLRSHVPAHGQGEISSEKALARLKEGNQRFVNGQSDHPRQDLSRIKEVADGQHRLKKPSVFLDGAIRENVLMQFDQLKGLEPILATRVREGSIKIVGALYDLHAGKIEFFE